MSDREPGTGAEQAEAPDRRAALAPRPPGPGILELLAIGLIAATAIFPFAWVPGLLLAWISRAWHPRDKAIATVFPILGFILLTITTLAVPTEPGSSGGAPASPALQPFDFVLATYGLVGAPLTAGLYLALRMLPRPRRPLVVFSVLAAFAVFFALAVAFLMPSGQGGA